MNWFLKTLTMVILCITMAFFVSCENENADNKSANGDGNTSTMTTNVINGHECVDLGLPSGTLWATCNVGATNPEDYGGYFAWGETTTKGSYDLSNYKWCNSLKFTTTKYNTQPRYANDGMVDNKTVLEPDDDAATVNWGDGWRTPTAAEWMEMYNNTTNQWATRNGVCGRLFTSTVAGHTGVSFFIPAAGYRNAGSLNYAGSYGYYWSSTLSTKFPSDAYNFGFHSDNVAPLYGYYRCNGFSVRPVR